MKAIVDRNVKKDNVDPENFDINLENGCVVAVNFARVKFSSNSDDERVYWVNRLGQSIFDYFAGFDLKDSVHKWVNENMPEDHRGYNH